MHPYSDEDPDLPAEADMDRFGDDTLPCPSCGHRVSDHAPQCPRCKHWMSREDRSVPPSSKSSSNGLKNKIFILAAIAVILAFLLGYGARIIP